MVCQDFFEKDVSHDLLFNFGMNDTRSMNSVDEIYPNMSTSSGIKKDKVFQKYVLNGEKKRVIIYDWMCAILVEIDELGNRLSIRRGH